MKKASELNPLLESRCPDIKWDHRFKTLPTPVGFEKILEPLLSRRVYRYCTLPELLALFCRSEWTFLSPQKWPDKYERHVCDLLHKEKGPFAYATPFLKCMSFQYSSNAMWRTYAGPLGVFRLSITLGDLIRMIGQAEPSHSAKVYVVRTRYLKAANLREEVRRLTDQKPAKDVARYAVPPLTLKRDGFSYENEVRLCAMTKNGDLPLEAITFTNVIPRHVHEVLIDPYMPAWQADEVRRLLVDQVQVEAVVGQSRFDANVGAL